MKELSIELKELTFKFGKLTTNVNLTMDETYRAVEVYLLLLEASKIMLRGGDDVSKS